ncbi:hypothetical protein SNE40_014813 [Patella caerulea]|uniref:Uncharacterized protein n=1 Tax=Patella caerulea TaxID=87958 RepID=A0AAN8PU31_PATCE
MASVTSDNPGLLGKTNTEDLIWIIPTAIAVIVLLFLTALGLFHCCLGMGDCFFDCIYKCGCYRRKQRGYDMDERIPLTEHPLPMYESSGNRETTYYQMSERNRL